MHDFELANGRKPDREDKVVVKDDFSTYRQMEAQLKVCSCGAKDALSPITCVLKHFMWNVQELDQRLSKGGALLVSAD